MNRSRRHPWRWALFACALASCSRLAPDPSPSQLLPAVAPVVIQDSVVNIRPLEVVIGRRPDDTGAILDAMDSASQSGKRLYFPPGHYLFNGENIPWERPPILDTGVTVANRIYAGIIAQDTNGTVVGLQHNHLETEFASAATSLPITSGNLLPPPVADPPRPNRLTIVAHWYNDFGLEATRRGAGWIGWYTWQWNHHGNPHGYDQSRQPLLGWYRGDDSLVIDWTCHWLVRYGVSAVTLLPSEEIDPSTWQSPGDHSHWIYQFLNHTRNCGRLAYVLLGSVRGDPRTIAAAWHHVFLDIYLNHPTFYKMEHRGGLYPVIYLFEGEELRQALDSLRGARRTAQFLTSIAQEMRAAGYAGIAVWARHPTSARILNRDSLEAAGVLYLSADYDGRLTYTNGRTYADLVRNFAPPVRPDELLAVPTATFSHWPHPSHWSQAGSTPDLFGRWLRKAIDHILARDMPRILLIYNVSEWAEGGPGLIPNMQDGFGYLDAVRRSVRVP